MDSNRILIIEDDKDLHPYLRTVLQDKHFIVMFATTGARGIAALEESRPDLILLDINLPDITGESVLGEIRKRDPQIPVIMLTAKNDLQTKISTLSNGADDYMTKPFDGTELIARINTRLRPTKGKRDVLRVADLELDQSKIEVKRAGKTILLTPQEFKLLEYLMSNKGLVLSRDMILDRIWAYSHGVETRVVDVYMGYLRKKIDMGFDKKLFQSVRGFGYTIRE